MMKVGAVLNMGLAITTLLATPPSPTTPHHTSPLQSAQKALGFVYALVAAFRSWWPRVDAERWVIVDSPLSSIGLGRSTATVAEIGFSIQMAIFVSELDSRAHLDQPPFLPIVLVVAITTAQACCWAGVLTTSHLWHALEESIWTCVVAVVGITSLSSLSSLSSRPWIIAATVSSIASLLYVLYMLIIDVPMYVRKWLDDHGNGNGNGNGDGMDDHASCSSQFLDAWTRRVPQLQWENAWKQEALWMTGYFWCGVWLSLSLAWLPYTTVSITPGPS